MRVIQETPLESDLEPLEDLGAHGGPLLEVGLPTECAYKVVLQKSTPAQIRQLIIYISNNKGYVDEFVRELTFRKTTLQTLSVRSDFAWDIERRPTHQP